MGIRRRRTRGRVKLTRRLRGIRDVRIKRRRRRERCVVGRVFIWTVIRL
jgi:hypothetical protein